MKRLICLILGHKWPRNVYHTPIYATCERCGMSYKAFLGDEE